MSDAQRIEQLEEQVARVRLMCKTLLEEIEENPVAQVGNAAMGIRTAVRAINHALGETEEP